VLSETNPSTYGCRTMKTLPTVRERAFRSSIRAQIASLSVASMADAVAANASSLTMPYQTRQIAQCQALLNVLNDFANCPDRILIVDVGHGELEVWRKDALPV
jgi:hypothetical protein